MVGKPLILLDTFMNVYKIARALCKMAVCLLSGKSLLARTSPCAETAGACAGSFVSGFWPCPP